MRKCFIIIVGFIIAVTACILTFEKVNSNQCVSIAMNSIDTSSVVYSYYGELDTAVAKVALWDSDKENSRYYWVHTILCDSYVFDDCVKYCGLKYIYYCPDKDDYLCGFYDNQGVEIIREYNPYEKESR